MLVRDIEKAISRTEQEGFGFGPMSVSKSALVRLTRMLEGSMDRSPIRILELGGGQSTLFWSNLGQMGLLPLHVTTLEHQISWVNELRSRVSGEYVCLSHHGLKQLDDNERERLFVCPERAPEEWGNMGQPISEEYYSHYTIRNTFYLDAHTVARSAGEWDVMLLDGPHGNGRSLAFPLFASRLKQGALILIDDFDHYPFLEDLARVFPFEELYREIAGGKRWVIIQVTR